MNSEVAGAVAVGEVEEAEVVAGVQGEDAIRWILRKVKCLRGRHMCSLFAFRRSGLFAYTLRAA